MKHCFVETAPDSVLEHEWVKGLEKGLQFDREFSHRDCLGIKHLHRSIA
jgi:hypothetical protein